MFYKTTSAEIHELIHQTRCAAARKGWVTRRVRLWLEALYALEDPRG
jgi:hypothetical protein